MVERLLLDERILADGRTATTSASVAAGGAAIAIVCDDGVHGELSLAALDRVMTRYARPLDPGLVLDGPVLELERGHRLRRLRYHAAVDATGRDYLVWERPDHEPIGVLSTMVSAALRFLVLGIASARGGGGGGGGSQETED